MDFIPITVAYGDGIGPEVVHAALRLLQEVSAPLQITVVELGESIFKTGSSTGIPADAWESLRRTRVLLKGPILTPDAARAERFYTTLQEHLGDSLTIFEPPHGPLPEQADTDRADPTPMIEATLRMLEHLNLTRHAQKIRAALETVAQENLSIEAIGTSSFLETIIENL